MPFCSFSNLSTFQREEYKRIVSEAFPPVIFQSSIVQTCWSVIEDKFPEYQTFLVHEDGDIVGFMNTIPFAWHKDLQELPDSGWDWLVNKGLSDHENQITPNCLGGLQIIVSKAHLGKGYSKVLIEEGKRIVKEKGFDYFIIPIRPTLKSDFPEMSMNEYIGFKKEGKIYDPWIRTHLNNGADIIKVCHQAMYITGDISTWEKLMKQKIKTSGFYHVDGALTPVFMDLDSNQGEYKEPNIWIYYH